MVESQNITRANLFDVLVQYHLTRNVMPYIEQGAQSNLQEGEEDESSTGGLIMCDGSDFLKWLVDNGLTSKMYIDANSAAHIKHAQDVFDYFDNQRKKDGVHVFGDVNLGELVSQEDKPSCNQGIGEGNYAPKTLIRIRKMNNTPDSMRQDGFDPYTKFPWDFLSSDGSFPVEELGTKSLLSVELPHYYPQIEGMQIKRTAYGRLKKGKVTHTTTHGLTREVFFDHAPDSKGPFIEPAYHILAINRTYIPTAGGMMKTSESFMYKMPSGEFGFTPVR